jgi:hypothetical protein
MLMKHLETVGVITYRDNTLLFLNTLILEAEILELDILQFKYLERSNT